MNFDISKSQDPKIFLSNLIKDTNLEISSDQIIYKPNGKQNTNAFKKNNKSYLAKLFTYLQYDSVECPDCKDVSEHYSADVIVPLRFKHSISDVENLASKKPQI